VLLLIFRSTPLLLLATVFMGFHGVQSGMVHGAIHHNGYSYVYTKSPTQTAKGASAV
jgi:hypothetical protein